LNFENLIMSLELILKSDDEKRGSLFEDKFFCPVNITQYLCIKILRVDVMKKEDTTLLHIERGDTKKIKVFL